jgi:hypothetical protein
MREEFPCIGVLVKNCTILPTFKECLRCSLNIICRIISIWIQNAFLSILIWIDTVCLSPVIFETAYIIYLKYKSQRGRAQSTYKTSKENKQKWTIPSISLCVIISTITPMWCNSVAGNQDLWPTDSLSAGSDEVSLLGKPLVCCDESINESISLWTFTKDFTKLLILMIQTDYISNISV